MAVEQDAQKDGFVPASPTSEWYEHLDRSGSCLRLYDLLVKKRELIHKVGPEGLTVLHKGVQHGCVKLVRFILVDMFDGDGNCSCSQHVEDDHCSLTREGLLRKTCEYGSTAVNMAVVSGSPKMVLLLKWAIDVSNRCKNRGLTERKSSRGNKGVDGLGRYRRLDELCTSYITEKAGSGEEEGTEDTNDSLEHLEPVPDVQDDAIYEEIYGNDLSNRISKVYELIEEKLKKHWGDDQEEMDMLKDRCTKNVDFEFVPLAHVFLHFLLNIAIYSNDQFTRLREEILEEILVACNVEVVSVADDAQGSCRSLLVALFNILDPRGRTILHAAFHAGNSNAITGIPKKMGETMDSAEREEFSRITRECLNARDGAGRTLLHLACIYDAEFTNELQLDWDVLYVPRCSRQLGGLMCWCFPSMGLHGYDYGPIHLAVIFDSTYIFLDDVKDLNVEDVNILINRRAITSFMHWSALGIGAVLGRTEIVKNILEYHTKFKCIEDRGFGTSMDYRLPVIHCAALSGQVEIIQTILEYPAYDPICQDITDGTALHLLLGMNDIMYVLVFFKTIALCHVLPNSEAYTCVKNDFCIKDDHLKLHVDENTQRMFSDNEVSCINLLLQAGIDLWTPHWRSKERPNPGPMANNEARKWWFDKVVKEVVIQQSSITGAANAISVIGALVATTSFIGPLQPPLSYSADGGYIDTTRSAVRVYLVCNSLSFFFSIASILMAVLPAIPMPKESMYGELLRSQRCLKAAALMLLISIICLLMSFSSASIAVVSSDWHDKQLVVASLLLGGGICAVVLVIYFIRFLRMVFHENNRFRRRFAKYMYF